MKGGSFAALVFLLLAAEPAWATPGRMVYANGKVHRIFISTSDGYQYYDIGGPTDPANGKWAFVADPGTTSIKGYQRCTGPMVAYGESVALFNNKIFHAFTGETSCGGFSSTGLSAYVSTFDLAQKKWISKKTLGRVRTDTAGHGQQSGAAITVLSGQLVVFTDSATYTSADGSTWASHPALDTNINHQPLDAVTYYPPGADPRVLIVYGVSAGTGNIFYGLWAASWNGQFGTSSVVTSYGKLAIPSEESIYGRVSLLPGTKAAGNGFAAGGKKAAVQLFANTTIDGTSLVRNIEFLYDQTSGTWRVDPLKFQQGGDSYGLMVYPWYESACDTAAPANQARKQRFALVFHGGAIVLDSDYMKPLNHDVAITSCSASGFASTATAWDDTDPEGSAIRQNYWALAGIVLGSPPFALNGLADPVEIAEISNVDFGQAASGGEDHVQKWAHSDFHSAALQFHTGFFDEALGMKREFDITYKHDYEYEHGDSWSQSSKFVRTLGTKGSATEELGTRGWAIFHVPVVYVQDFGIYAYDYNKTTGTGTYVNQDLHSIEASPNAIDVLPVGFELADPGGPNDDFPGLLAGMTPFPHSTDLAGWATQTWEPVGGDSRWDVKVGDGTLGELRAYSLDYTNGAGGQVGFGNSESETETSAESKAVSIGKGMSVEVGTRLRGFRASLTSGYDSAFSTTLKTKTRFGQHVTADLYMKPCEVSNASCVRTLYVQPYLLKAKDTADGANAPWLPTAYKTSRPWCMTWRVTHTTYGTGAVAGTALAPRRASGRIVSGNGDGHAGEPFGNYSIEGGRLAWMVDGAEKRIPMTANDFVPSRGIWFAINGIPWSSSGKLGSWTRSGDTWTFEPRASKQQNRVMVTLDFAAATFDLHIQRANLEGLMLAGARDAMLQLVVNGRYTFHTALRHDLDIAWRWNRDSTDAGAFAVTSLEGRYDSGRGSGRISLKGTLPRDLPAFGDLGLEINGAQIIIPFLSMDDFEEAVENGGTLRYVHNGLIAEADLGKKTWSVSLNGRSFGEPLAPRWGKLGVTARVGGVPHYKAELPVVDFTARLTLQ
jgi:hypothetical protein